MAAWYEALFTKPGFPPRESATPAEFYELIYDGYSQLGERPPRPRDSTTAHLSDLDALEDDLEDQIDELEAAIGEGGGEGGGGAGGDGKSLIAEGETLPSIVALSGGGVEVQGYQWPIWGYGGNAASPNQYSPTLLDLDEFGVDKMIWMPGATGNRISTPFATALAGNTAGGSPVARRQFIKFDYLLNEYDPIAGQSAAFLYNVPNALWFYLDETGYPVLKFRDSAKAVFTATATAQVTPRSRFRGYIDLNPKNTEAGNVWTVDFYAYQEADDTYAPLGDQIVGTKAISAYKQVLTDQSDIAYTDQSVIIGAGTTGLQMFRGGFFSLAVSLDTFDATPNLIVDSNAWDPASNSTSQGGRTWTLDSPQADNRVTQSCLAVAGSEKIHLTGPESAPISVDIATARGLYPTLTASGFSWSASSKPARDAYRKNNSVMNLSATAAVRKTQMTLSPGGDLEVSAPRIMLGLAEMATRSYADSRALAARSGAVAEANTYAQAAADAVLAQIANATPFNPFENITTAGVQRIYAGLIFESNGPTHLLPPMGIGDGSEIDQKIVVSTANPINLAAGITGGYGAEPTYLTDLSDNATSPAPGSLRRILKDFRTEWLANRGAKLWLVAGDELLDLVDEDGACHILLDNTPLTGNAQYLRLLERNMTIDMTKIPGGLILDGNGKPGPPTYGTLSANVTAGTYTESAPAVLSFATAADFGKVKLKPGIHLDLGKYVSGVWTRYATKLTVKSITYLDSTNPKTGPATVEVYGTIDTTTTSGTLAIYNPDYAGLTYEPGVKGTRVGIGGFGWDDCFGPGKQNIPAGNIIIRNVAIRSNWGGDVIDTGDMKDFTVAYWADNVWLDHMDFSNPDPFHDTLTSFVIGTRDIGTSFCAWRNHYKAVNHFGGVTGTGGQNPDGTYNSPNEHPFPPKPYPPYDLYTVDDPGPYDYEPGVEVGHGNPNAAPLVRITACHEHDLFEGLGQRSPKNDHFGEMHLLNSVVKDWGLPVFDTALGVTSRFPLDGEEDPGNTPAVITNDGAKSLIQNVTFIPYDWATSSKTIKRTPTGKSPTGFIRTANITTKPAADTGFVPTREADYDPSLKVPDFTARYSFTPEPAEVYEAKVLNGAGAGTQSKMWSLVGVAAVAGSIVVKHDGANLGPAGAAAPASAINFIGGTVTYDSDTRTVEVTLSGSSVPDASTTTKGIVELATSAETLTGTDLVRAVTPAGVKAALEAYAQPLDPDLGLIAGLSTTSFGRNLLTAADAAALRAAASLGTAATKDVGTGSTKVAAGDVPIRLDYTFPAGNAVLTTGVFRAPIHEDSTIASVRVTVGTPPTGSPLILDVKKNGTSIYAATPANRPTVATGASSAVGGAPDTTALAAGDYLTVDIVQVGSTNPSANVVLSVLLKRA